MSSPYSLRNLGRLIHVGVILLNGTTEVLDVTPVDVLNGLTESFLATWPPALMPADLRNQTVPMQFHWVSETGDKPVLLTSGVNIVPTDSFTTSPTLDVVLIGAHNEDVPMNQAEIRFIQKTWNDCLAFLTVCSGVDFAIQAGILKGKTATGPRAALPVLRQQAPDTNWVEKRWVRDGKLWTSGAYLNGLDLAAAFVKENWGGNGTLADYLSKLGSWPMRDVDYKDVPWDI